MTSVKNPVGWFEIYVDSIARAKAFYEAVFQITLTKLESPEGSADLEMWSFPGVPTQYGAGGALVKKSDVPAGKNSVLVYFSCDDCAVEESRIVANGGQVINTKFSIGEHGFISIITDTEGNCIGLHSMN